MTVWGTFVWKQSTLITRREAERRRQLICVFCVWKPQLTPPAPTPCDFETNLLYTAQCQVPTFEDCLFTGQMICADHTTAVASVLLDIYSSNRLVLSFANVVFTKLGIFLWNIKDTRVPISL